MYWQDFLLHLPLNFAAKVFAGGLFSLPDFPDLISFLSRRLANAAFTRGYSLGLALCRSNVTTASMLMNFA